VKLREQNFSSINMLSATPKPLSRHAFIVGLAFLTSLTHSQVTHFSQKTVAGTANDLMIVRHLVIRGDNTAVGKKLAEIAKRQHQSTLSKNADAKIWSKQWSWLKANYPERYERSIGVRIAYGLAEDTQMDITSLPIDMSLNPSCSVVYYPGSSVTNGHAMFSRNYDFPKASYAELTRRGSGGRSMTGDPYVIEMHPTKGYASLYTCAYDLLGGAVDGVNEKGVAVALLADDMSNSRTRGTAGFGLSEVDLPRYVLDRAANAKEARKLLKSIPYYATFIPCHYIIGDATGDSFIFEVGPDGKHYIIDGGGKPQIITNHSIAEYGTTKLPEGNSFDRYRRLQKELAGKPKYTPQDVKVNNYCVTVPTSVRVAATLWHAVYDLKDRSVSISFCLSSANEDSERRTPYLNFKLGSK
jgi:predicted choloylglycine hydrolase